MATTAERVLHEDRDQSVQILTYELPRGYFTLTAAPWRFTFDLHAGAEVLAVTRSGSTVILHVRSDLKAMCGPRVFYAVPSNEPAPIRAQVYVGTAFADDEDDIAVHVFEER